MSLFLLLCVLSMSIMVSHVVRWSHRIREQLSWHRWRREEDLVVRHFRTAFLQEVDGELGHFFDQFVF